MYRFKEVVSYSRPTGSKIGNKVHKNDQLHLATSVKVYLSCESLNEQQWVSGEQISTYKDSYKTSFTGRNENAGEQALPMLKYITCIRATCS